MAMAMQPRRRNPTPLDAAKLEELALGYVGRFATTRCKLAIYLNRKLRERGWAGDDEPPVEELTERLVRLGYVDDRAYAMAKARSLAGRGYGQRRVRQALAQAGIGEEDANEAREFSAAEAVEAALRFARRRSIGPFAAAELDPQQRERALTAMVRAGHDFAISKAIIALNPGENTDSERFIDLR